MYVGTSEGVAIEMRARGMPLGLMDQSKHEEKEIGLGRGDQVLFHGDGVAEAHDPQRQTFGFLRVKAFVGSYAGRAVLLQLVLQELERFTGPGWQQEDDVTLVSLRRAPAHDLPETARLLSEFALPGQPAAKARLFSAWSK